MDARGVVAGAGGAVGVVAGLTAALGDLPALALVSAAGAAVAAGVAVDFARSSPAAEPPPADPPTTLVDPTTGLFIEAYFDASLEARVATARRVLRPLSVGLVEIVDVDDSGEPAGPTDLAGIRDAVHATVREADMVFALRDGLMALLLEDTPEDGGTWTIERIRRAVGTDERGRRLWAGLASYPSHGLTAAELIDAARAALAEARDWPQDRIEVATG